MGFKRRPPENNVRRVQHVSGNQRYTITSKAGETVQCESNLERRLALRADRNPNVKRYTSQPETLQFIDSKGHRSHYTPDFRLEFFNGDVELHEVTLESRRQEKASIRAREEIARLICNARGWKYVVHIQEVLPNDTELANLFRFYSFRPNGFGNNLIARLIKNSLMSKQPRLARQIVEELSKEHDIAANVLYPVLAHMVWHNELDINWQVPFFDGVLPHRLTGKVDLVNR